MNAKWKHEKERNDVLALSLSLARSLALSLSRSLVLSHAHTHFRSLARACSLSRWAKPCTVPEVSPVTQVEHRRYEEAGIRRSLRIDAANDRKEREIQRSQQSKL